MRILIERCGSGWGGIFRRRLYDIQNRVCINLDKCFSITKNDVFYTTNVLHMMLSEFPQTTISPCNHNLSLLEMFLPDCELSNPEYTMFDQQTDIVHILTDDGSIRCVYNSSFNITPINPALCAKLNRLIDAE